MDYSLPGSCPWDFSRQEYCSGLPSLSAGDPPDPGIESECSALAGGSFTKPPGRPLTILSLIPEPPHMLHPPGRRLLYLPWLATSTDPSDLSLDVTVKYLSLVVPKHSGLSRHRSVLEFLACFFMLPADCNFHQAWNLAHYCCCSSLFFWQLAKVGTQLVFSKYL